jgi:aryl-alcohol dehydrogenase-like predicted oxidoreductase
MSQEMEWVPLGRSGLKVSRLCLGTMTFGNEASDDQAARIVDLCLERGVGFWDTADMYGGGASERVIGRLLAGRRHRIVLATKGYAAIAPDGAPPGPNDRGLSARHLIAACEASLRRLGTDFIDLYYLHLPDRSVPLDETLRAVEDLVRGGKVRYVGASNYRAWEVMELLGVAREHRWQPLTAIQPLYNIVNRDIEVELLPMAERQGLGVVTYSPLARGVLTGKYSWQAPPPAESRLSRSNPRFLRAEWREESVAVAEALRPLAAARGLSLGQLALGWALANRKVSSVIFGARTVEQAEQALAAYDHQVGGRIDGEVEAAVDRLVPPGCHTGYGFPDPDYFPVLGRSR